MGVSGSGKTTIGLLLSEKLGIDFLDADDFHPKENVQKMQNGIALTDADRIPWLNLLATEISKKDLVLACSALKHSYRKLLESMSGEKIHWVYLKGSKELIAKRLALRKDHFMSADLLQSQFDALETPENCITVDITKTPTEIVNHIVEKVIDH